MRGSEGMLLTLAVIAVLNKLCRSCSTGETRFADVASRTVVSSVVFEGKMLHPVEVSNPSKFSAVRFQVEKVFKGDLPNGTDSVVVATRVANGQLDCLENLRPRRRYIVFLSSATEMVGDVAAYKVFGPPEEYSGRAAKDVEAHSCRNCVQKPSARLAPKKLSSAKTGSNITLKCLVRGRPFPSISWYKNDQPLSSKNSEHLVIKSQKTNSVLTIRNVSSEDEGVYWCQAVNVLATANSTTVTLAIRKGGGGDGQPEDVKDQGSPCPAQNKKYCLNGGECRLLPDGRTKYCICAPGYTGPRCQDRESEVVPSKIDVRASNMDKALVFVGLFLTLLVLFILIAILYCIAKMRYEFSLQKQHMVNEVTAHSPHRSEPPLVNNQKENHLFIQPAAVHITEVEDTKSYNALARRQRLSAVSSAIEADPDFNRNQPKPNHEESVRRNKRIPSSRVSTSSSNQGLLLVDDDVVDGGAPGKCDPHLARCHQPVRCALDTCSATSLDPDSSRPLSSRSNYENERLCASHDRLNSPRRKTEALATGNGLRRETPKRSVEYKLDASNQATEEVNNLLRELGVYLPEDASN